jgi:tetraacyldisaccharide 4'-kinase
MLTDYSNLFTRDWFLPTGDLRDEKRSYRRAEVIVVTKCPPDLTPEERNEITREIRPLEQQRLFFTAIRYGKPYHITRKNEIVINDAFEVLLVSGIANPAPLKKYLQDVSGTYFELLYGDHHIFTIDDWREIVKHFNNIQAKNKIILTTEKDAVRLVKFAQELKDFPVYVIPIEIEFLFNEEKQYSDLIGKFISEFRLSHEA